jgi:2-polyprenyl-6-methoxyphenol hydroxylase-like FAD-dependent oxidoreductase
MLSRKPITIAGGGLAGLTLGIGLQQRGVPVTIWEAGSYPRHRVCGEFISGNGQRVLERLGLLAQCHRAGAVYAHTALFVCGTNRSPVRRLDPPALCLSRHALDALLAEAFERAGGELRVNARWSQAKASAGLVLASGRRPQTGGESPRWFGVKAHVPRHSPVALAADLEMYVSGNGYVGINRIGSGEVNVCGLFRAQDIQRTESRPDWLRGGKDSLLRERLQAAEFDPHSFCSVGGLQLKPQRAAARADCSIGDAQTMTPPVTGNGMSMAFESAEMAIGPLAEYSAGRGDWETARREIARRCDDAFGRRLAWARLLQRVMMSPAMQGRWGAVGLRSEWLWRLVFAKTR